MNSTHRFACIVAVAALVAGAPARGAWAGTDPACPAAWDGDQQQTEKFSKTVPLPKGGSLDLSNISGDIVITGGAGDQVVIDAVKRGNTAEDLKLVQIEVTTTATRVEVRTQYPRERRNISVSVDYTVTMPRDGALSVHSVSGDLRLKTINGVLTAETVSGDVTINGAGQLESAKTVSGDVLVDTAASEGDVSVSSVSGDVTLKAVKARGIEANSVSGNVEFADVTCEPRPGQVGQRRHRASTARWRRAAATRCSRTPVTSSFTRTARPGSKSRPARSAATSSSDLKLDVDVRRRAAGRHAAAATATGRADAARRPSSRPRPRPARARHVSATGARCSR